MPKKGGGKKGGKKGKKGPEDWGTLPRPKFVELDVRNSEWRTMRFTVRLPTSTKIKHIVEMIVERHRVAGASGLQLYLGEDIDETNLLRPDEYGLAIGDVKVQGGSINDHVLQVVTYEYAPHRTEDAPTVPPSRNYGTLHLPTGMHMPPLRQWGPC